MTSVIVKEYLGNGVEFKMIDDSVYANATSMAKGFDNGLQKLKDWKRSSKTKELLDELNKINEVEKSHIKLIISDKGGNSDNCTWIEENLLLDFAQYLSIGFKVWCNNQISTLLREGRVELQPQYKLPTNFKEALIMLVEAEEVKEKLQLENKQQAEVIETQKPKADYFDAIVESKLLTNFRDTAKEFKVKETDFINMLLEKGYVYRDAKKKLKPIAKYVPELFELKEFVNRNNGISDTQTKITPKGRETFRLLCEANLD